jgi:hypothetical protein
VNPESNKASDKPVLNVQPFSAFWPPRTYYRYAVIKPQCSQVALNARILSLPGRWSMNKVCLCCFRNRGSKQANVTLYATLYRFMTGCVRYSSHCIEPFGYF